MLALRSPSSLTSRFHQCLRTPLSVGLSGSNAATVLLEKEKPKITTDSNQTRNFHSPSYKRFIKNKGGRNYGVTSSKQEEQKQQQQQQQEAPCLGVAASLPTLPQNMSNETIVTLGALGNLEAREEILKRHIMDVDGVSYDDACKTFQKIEDKNYANKGFLSAPYNMGIYLALGTAVVSFPLCFDFNTVHWFNEVFVTADVPEPKDLETWLEVGAWAWNWMEPVMGQLSFVLLCLQYSRAQLDNLGRKPYTQRVKNFRAERLAKSFPQYNSDIIKGYSDVTPILGEK